MTEHPAALTTRAARAFLGGVMEGDAPRDYIDGIRDILFAIEREAVANFVWERLEAAPGFNEEMAAALADVKAGRVHRWEDVRRRLDEEGYTPPPLDSLSTDTREEPSDE